MKGMKIEQGEIARINGLDENVPGHFRLMVVENPYVEKERKLSLSEGMDITLEGAYLRSLAKKSRDIEGTRITLFEGERITVSLIFSEEGLEIKRYSLLGGVLFKKTIPKKEIYRKEPKRKRGLK